MARDRLAALLGLLLGAVTCAPSVSKGTRPLETMGILVERSQPAKPAWMQTTPESPDYHYFVGEGDGLWREEARAMAVGRLLENYALVLGAEFRLITSLHREEVKRIQDEVYRTSGQAVTEAEAFARISTRGMDFRADYCEKWSRGRDGSYYRVWLLGRVEKSFMAEERSRIDSLVQAAPPEPISTSNLTLVVQEEKARYRAGDTLRLVLCANDDCHYYYLNFEAGKVNCPYSGRLTRDRSLRLVCLAQYGGNRYEAMRFVASDKPLNADAALAKAYPAEVVRELRRQAQELGARYTEREIQIIIEPRN